MHQSLVELLEELEYSLPCNLPLNPLPVSGDKWLLCSGLQKAIRRGEADKAASFAASLWMTDRRMFWRRLHVIALEDVGPAAPDTVVQVLAAHEASDWRKRVGDRVVAIHLARSLANALKSRFCDELYMYLEANPRLPERRLLRSASPAKLAKLISAPDTDLTTRALASWMLCGTRLFPSKVIPDQAGNAQLAINAFEDVPCPALLRAACIAVIPRTQWPLCIFTILGWSVFEREQGTSLIVKDDLEAVPEFEGIPIYAVDGQFTRLGQSCLQRLRKEVTQLQLFTPAQIAQASFWVEGGRLNLSYMSPMLKTFKNRSILSVMSNIGLDEAQYAELDNILRSSWSRYNQIRLEKLEFSVCGPQYNLFHGA